MGMDAELRLHHRFCKDVLKRLDTKGGDIRATTS
jgi:hypothetical protein